MKKAKRICSVMIIAVMLILSFATITAGAADKKYYTTMDISSAATGKFWVDPTVSAELSTTHYSGSGWNGTSGYKKDFVAASGGLAYSVKAAKYPMTIDTKSKDTVPDTAWVMKDNSLRTPSGVPYVMPKKTSTAAEKEVISLGDNTTYSQTVNIKSNVKKVHFLVASAFGRDMTFSVQPIYTDTSYTQDKTTFTIVGGNTADDPAEVCRLEARETLSSNDFATNASDGVFGGTLALHEYSIDIAYPDVQVSHLKFTASSTTVLVGSSYRIGSFAVVAITTEDASGTEAAGLASTSATIADGSYTVTTSAPIEGTAILAVYNEKGDKLIAVGTAELKSDDFTKTIAAASEDITAGGTYTAKVMLWDDVTDTFVPLTSAVAVN